MLTRTLTRSLICLMLCLALLPAAALAEESGDYREIAREKLIEISGLPEDALTVYETVYNGQDEFRPELYRVEFAHPSDRALYFRVYMDADGNVVEYGPENFGERAGGYSFLELQEAYAREETARWEANYGENAFWPYDLKAAFYRAYGVSPGYSAVERGLPGAEDIGEEEAVRAAYGYLLERFHLEEAELEAMPHNISFFPEMPGLNAPCWVVALHDTQPGEDGRRPLLLQVNVPSPEGALSGYVRGRGWSASIALAKLPETLYYNPNGEGLFHTDASCTAVDEQYRPLSPFDRADLLAEAFAGLLPCEACVK